MVLLLFPNRVADIYEFNNPRLKLEKQKMIELQVKIIREGRELINNIQDYLATKTINELENCCDMICHLKQNHKDKISDEELYNLAKIIKTNFPDSEIDWINTFTQVESFNYLNVLESNLDEDKEVDVFDNIESVLDNENEVESHSLSKNFREIALEKLYVKKII